MKYQNVSINYYKTSSELYHDCKQKEKML
jgi:hypothetical protein